MLSLQACSHEQKTRVCWCLMDNIVKQQPRTTPTAPPAESKVRRGSERKGCSQSAQGLLAQLVREDPPQRMNRVAH